jgi:hypothetical protein
MSSLSSDTLINPQDLYDITVAGTVNTGGVFGETATLGNLATTGDGRYFRYCIAGGTALVPGKLQQTAAETTGWENLAIAAAAIGATSITTTSTVTVTANQLTGGYAMVTTGTGVGYQYQIGTHPAVTSAVLTFNITDPIIVALDTTSKLDLVANPYNGVIVNPASASGFPVGVAVAAIPAAYYGWVQTRGVTNVLADGAITVGTALVASNAVAGAVEPLTGVQQIVGTAMTGISTTEYGSVNLNLS